MQQINVLMVEDSVDDAALVLRELHRGGYAPESERVDTPSGLRTAFAKRHWDIVLVDFTMPQLTGMQALEMVRSWDRDVPFIFVSGTIGEDTAVAAVKAGANDYIMKSGLRRLLPAVDRELREAQQRRDRRRYEEEVRLMQDIAVAAATSVDMSAALEVVLRRVAEVSGSEFAQAWTPVADGSRLEPGPAWFAQGALLSALCSAGPGLRPDSADDPVARAWTEKRAVWAGDRTRELALRAAQREAGCVASMAMPVMAGGEVVAVLEFCLRQPSSDDELLTRLVAAVATQLGNIIQRKRAEERLSYLAHYDPLTDLPNRVLLSDRLRQALGEARQGRLVGVGLLDLDRFKTINDGLGYEVGDLLLRAVAQRLADCMEQTDTVARLSSDEFGVIFADMPSAEHADTMVGKLVDALRQPFMIEGRELFTGASLGFAMYPGDDETVEGLLRCADVAMYRVKETGGNNYQFYRSEMIVNVAQRLSFESGLRRALDRGEFYLHYQPKARLEDGRITGVEALIRWRSPAGVEIPPAHFIPLAEEVGLIAPIGAWVLLEACTQGRAWLDAGHDPLRIAVNLSTRQFLRPDLGASVEQVLEQTGLPAANLELEITEHSLMQYTREGMGALQQLADLGLSLVLDDFGTGYSSLAYLKRFPLDALKIDRSFVQDIPQDGDDAAIVTAIIAMAHRLELNVVAEGVETAEQLAFLRHNGCDEVQGFLLSRPVPPEQIGPLLARGVLPRAT